MRIEELMTRSPSTCTPDDTLNEAVQTMWGSNCGCLPVITDDGSHRLLGVITDHEICLAALVEGRIHERTLNELRVRDAMVEQVRACNPGDSLDDVEAIMHETHLRRIPVVDQSNQLVGMLSLADLAREAAWERE